MSTTVAGNRCAYCGTWLSGTDPHWCEKMHPNWSPSWSTAPDPRVTDALERLARHLVELTEVVHKIAVKLDAEDSNQEHDPATERWTQEELDALKAQAADRAERFGWTDSNQESRGK